MTELSEKIRNFGVRDLTPVVMALDQDWRECRVWVERLRGKVWGFKVGSILYAELGPKIIDELKSQNCGVFLDLKFHDIPRTVQLAVRQAFQHGADWLTVHASGGREMLKAAAAEQTEAQSVLSVGVLTSLDENSLRELGYSETPQQRMESFSRLAIDAGIKGLICSVQEVEHLRSLYPTSLLVTPGVRLTPSSDDQKRTGTLVEAIEKGASYAVLGRALYESKDWEKTWDEIQSSMAAIRS